MANQGPLWHSSALTETSIIPVSKFSCPLKASPTFLRSLAAPATMQSIRTPSSAPLLPFVGLDSRYADLYLLPTQRQHPYRRRRVNAVSHKKAVKRGKNRCIPLRQTALCRESLSAEITTERKRPRTPSLRWATPAESRSELSHHLIEDA